ncbi:hypothetical protein TcG_05143, partial [Trypanosoma cruzi]
MALPPVHPPRLMPLTCGSSRVAVQDLAALAQRVHDVHGRDGLLAGVLRVRRGVAHDALHERLDHATHLVVDDAGDALHAATARQAADGPAGDSTDVLAQDLLLALLRPLRLAALLALRH